MFPHSSDSSGRPNFNRRRLSSVLNIRSFRGTDYGADHSLVVAKVRERLAVNKRATQKFDVERVDIKKLNDIEGK
jgi:hypothetical protein